MRVLWGVLFLCAMGSAAFADTPKCSPTPRSPIPAEVRVQVWSQYLQENPKTEHREKILKEIEQALAEMWGKPDCDSLLRDATVNPFKDYPDKKVTPPTNKDIHDSTIDPFRTQDGILVDPFKKRPPQSYSGPQNDDDTVNPFAPNAPKGPQGPKKPMGNATLDPFANPQAEPPAAPEDPTSIESDGVLVNPFKKKKK